jgi:hypothetical protein
MKAHSTKGATSDTMSAQDIFNVVSAHLLTQGSRAQTTGPSWGQCVYRAKDGKKCAAGVLIPNELYTPRMEGNNFRAVLTEFPELPDWMRENAALITELQIIHDVYEPYDWRRKLNELARDRGFTPVLEEAA